MTRIYLEDTGWASPTTHQQENVIQICDLYTEDSYIRSSQESACHVLSAYYWLCVISLCQGNIETDLLFPPSLCDCICYQICYLNFPQIPFYWLNSFSRFINSMSSRPRVIRQISHMSRSALLNNSAAGICMEKSSLGAWRHGSAWILLHIITADTAAHYTASGTEWAYS